MAVLRLALSILVLASISTPARAADAAATGLSALERQQAEQLAQGLTLLGRHRARLWPGYDLQRIPFIFHREGGVAFLVNHDGALPSGFEPIAGLPGAAVRRGGAYAAGIDISVAIGDRKGVTVGFDHVSPAEALTTAVHEAFHQHQTAYAFGKGGFTQDLDFFSARDVALAEVEQILLSDALEATAPAVARERTLRFLAVRHARHLALPAQRRAAERALEAVEGTANYVELQSRLIASEQGGEAHRYPFGRTRAAVLADMSMALRTPLDESRFGRTRYYATGAAMGFLLDGLVKGWQAKVQGGAAIDALLASGAGLTASGRDAAWKAVQARFDLPAATRRHEALLKEVAARQASALKAFHGTDAPRVIVEIPFEFGGVSTSSSGLSFRTGRDSEFYEQVTISVEAAGASLRLQGAMLEDHTEEAFRFTLYTPIAPDALRIDGRPIGREGRHVGALNWRSEAVGLTGVKATVEAASRQVRIRIHKP